MSTDDEEAKEAREEVRAARVNLINSLRQTKLFTDEWLFDTFLGPLDVGDKIPEGL